MRLKRKNLLTIIQILSVLLLAFLIIYPKKDKTEKIYSRDGNSTITPFTKGTSIEGAFICGSDSMNQIDIIFSTFAKRNKTGNIDISLFDSNKDIIKEVNESIINLKDNEVFSIKFNDIKNSRGKIFYIRIICENCTEETSLTSWYSNSSNSGEYTIVDGKRLEKVLSITTFGREKNYAYIIFPILLLALSSTLKSLEQNEKNHRNL